jgi:hypothetical protein
MLVTHTRKMNCEYATAVNGLHALEIYRETTRPFDYVLMGKKIFNPRLLWMQLTRLIV